MTEEPQLSAVVGQVVPASRVELILTAIEAAGCVVVPKPATPEMAAAAFAAFTGGSTLKEWIRIMNAGNAASPFVPETKP